MVGGRGYIRTGDTTWGANVTRDPNVKLVIGDEEYALRADFVEAEDERALVMAAFNEKYGWHRHRDRLVPGGAAEDHAARLALADRELRWPRSSTAPAAASRSRSRRAPRRRCSTAPACSEADMDKAQVGIASVWYEGNPCNMHLHDLAAKVKEGVVAAGLVGMRFNTIGVSDGISMGTEGMSYSLQSRDLIADSHRDGDGRAVVRRQHLDPRLRQEHAGLPDRDGAASTARR